MQIYSLIADGAASNQIFGILWNSLNKVSLAVNKAALRCAYEHGSKRKRKCHLNFSEVRSLQRCIHIILR